MRGYKIIDKESWSRTDHYNFYRKFDNSCFNVCVSVKAQKLYGFSKERGESFFQLCLFSILRAANSIPQLKQRTLGDEVIEYNEIKVMTPIMTKDEGFRQIMCESTPFFTDFRSQIDEKIEEVKNAQAGPMIIQDEDFFCASCLPWLHFNSITHAEFHFGAAVPTLTWGQLKDGVVPVACKFNHAYVDGLHASRFFACIEDNFNNPDLLYIE